MTKSKQRSRLLVPLPLKLRMYSLFPIVICAILVFTWVQRVGFESIDPQVVLNAWHGATDDPALAGRSRTPDPELCTADEIAHGRWVQGEELRDVQDVRRKFRYTEHGGKIHCDFRSDDKDPAKSEQRLLHLARADLVPARPGGCRVIEFERTQWIIRALRSRAGVVMVGDSLIEHHLYLMEGLLVDNIDYRTDLVQQKQRSFYLNAKHPDAAAILASAGVSAERTERPILQSYRVDHVFDEDELRMLFDHAGDRLVIRPKNQTKWYPEVVELLSHPVVFTREGVLEEPTVLLTSIGPHWMRGDLGKDTTDDDMSFSYRKAIDYLDHKIRTTPYPVSFFWRTTSPGQLSCETIEEFDNQRQYHMSPVDPLKRAHNYMWFPWMNDMVRAGHSSVRPPGSFDFIPSPSSSQQIPQTELNPTYTLLEVWPMSIKRPEAHLGPPIDCLHWCQPGLQNWWQMLFWHQTMLEARNTDYY